MHSTVVIDQCVKPHVHDMLVALNWLFWTCHTPVKSAAANRQVVQLFIALYPLKDFFTILPWLNKFLFLFKGTPEPGSLNCHSSASCSVTNLSSRTRYQP